MVTWRCFMKNVISKFNFFEGHAKVEQKKVRILLDVIKIRTGMKHFRNVK